MKIAMHDTGDLTKFNLSFRPSSYIQPGDSSEDLVEVATIELVESVHGEIVRILARRSEDGWAYSMEDDYETAFALRRNRSVEPLTLGELIALIDTSESEYGTGYILPVLAMNLENSDEPAAALRSFLRVSSRFYPRLGPYYQQRVDGWIRENSAQETQDVSPPQ